MVASDITPGFSEEFQPTTGQIKEFLQRATVKGLYFAVQKRWMLVIQCLEVFPSPAIRDLRTLAGEWSVQHTRPGNRNSRLQSAA